MYGEIDFDDEEPVQLEFDPANDLLKLEKNREIEEIIQKEKFLFSDEIYEKGFFGFSQTYQLVITDIGFYILKNKKVQKKIEIHKLKGITVSIAKGCLEFVIHGNELEQDYLFYSKNKFQIIYILEGAFEKLRGKELDFICTESKDLKNRVTTKSDKKKDPKFTRMDETELYDIKEFFKHLYYRNYESKTEERELIYVDKIDEEEINPIIKKEGLVPLIQEIPKKKESKALKMTKVFNKNIKENFTNFNPGDKAVDKDPITMEEIEKFAVEFYEEDDEEEIPLKSAKYEDFNFGCCIGKGRISSTYIAKNNQYGVYYAVKVIDKEKALLSKALDNFKIEKKILTSSVSLNKSVVKMLNCFQTFDRIFFTYTFYREGDLLSFMEKQGGNFREYPDLIFFYICQLVMFLIKMHENRIIYRNLKPENIIIEGKGNLKMTDFSKSKILAFEKDKGLSFVGAPEYMSPEIILGKGQKYEVDWWSLGILIYQMIYGYTPFYDESVDKMFIKILYTNVKFDSNIEINSNLKSLIKGLLQKNPYKRLEDSDIRDHPYFTEGREVDWNKVAEFEIECPMKPVINEEKEDDIQNFDLEFTQEKYNNYAVKNGETLEYIKRAENFGLFEYFN